MRVFFLILGLLPLMARAQENLVPNGNFTLGFANFVTEYSLSNGAGSVDIRNMIPTTWEFDGSGLGLTSCDNANNDSLFICNGPSTEAVSDLDVIRTQNTIAISSNTCYRFGVWAKGNDSPATLELVLKNGTNIRRKPAVAVGGETWKFISGTFRSGATQTSVQLAIRDRTVSFNGNDFALDEMSLTKVNVFNTYADCGCPNEFILASDNTAQVEDRTMQEETFNKDWSVSVFPNPAKDVIQYDFRAVESMRYAVTLFDATGRQLYQADTQLTTGQSYGQIERKASWEAGLYFLKFTDLNTGKTLSKTIVID